MGLNVKESFLDILNLEYELTAMSQNILNYLTSDVVPHARRTKTSN